MPEVVLRKSDMLTASATAGRPMRAKERTYSDTLGTRSRALTAGGAVAAADLGSGIIRIDASRHSPHKPAKVNAPHSPNQSHITPMKIGPENVPNRVTKVNRPR